MVWQKSLLIHGQLRVTRCGDSQRYVPYLYIALPSPLIRSADPFMKTYSPHSLALDSLLVRQSETHS